MLYSLAIIFPVGKTAKPRALQLLLIMTKVNGLKLPQQYKSNSRSVTYGSRKLKPVNIKAKLCLIIKRKWNINLGKLADFHVSSSSAHNWLLHYDRNCLFSCLLPSTNHTDGPVITSIVSVNATGEIVHPATIPIFRHCHGLVSTNPILWSILNFAHFALKIEYNAIFGCIWYREEIKIYPQGLCGAQPNDSVPLHSMFLAG